MIWNAYLAVDSNGDFLIFSNKPQKIKREITVTSKTDFEWDYHGHHWYKEVPTGEFEHFWGIKDEDGYYDQGYIVNSKLFNEEIQKMTWDSEPLKL